VVDLFLDLFGLYSPPLAANSSYRRKPVSRKPDWIPPYQIRGRLRQARNGGPGEKTIPRCLRRGRSFCARLDQTSEVLEGAVIGRLPFFVKAAPGKLSHLEVVGDALAADSFPRTWIIGALAPGQVLIFVTFHRVPPPL